MFVDPYLANVTIFGGNFAPLSWMFCQGQLLSISQYTALYSLIGTTFGGDGIQTFALPDLSGRAAIHAGQGPGLSNFILGMPGGSETVSLTSNQMPPHPHVFISATGAQGASGSNGNAGDPTNNVPAVLPNINLYNTAGTAAMAATTATTNTVIAGQGLPLNILSPFTVMNYVICVEGIYPSRG